MPKKGGIVDRVSSRLTVYFIDDMTQNIYHIKEWELYKKVNINNSEGDRMLFNETEAKNAGFQIWIDRR
mgnify:CR=1 FL=1